MYLVLHLGTHVHGLAFLLTASFLNETELNYFSLKCTSRFLKTLIEMHSNRVECTKIWDAF